MYDSCHRGSSGQNRVERQIDVELDTERPVKLRGEDTNRSSDERTEKEE